MKNPNIRNPSSLTDTEKKIVQNQIIGENLENIDTQEKIEKLLSLLRDPSSSFLDTYNDALQALKEGLSEGQQQRRDTAIRKVVYQTLQDRKDELFDIQYFFEQAGKNKLDITTHSETDFQQTQSLKNLLQKRDLNYFKRFSTAFPAIKELFKVVNELPEVIDFEPVTIENIRQLVQAKKDQLIGILSNVNKRSPPPPLYEAGDMYDLLRDTPSEISNDQFDTNRTKALIAIQKENGDNVVHQQEFGWDWFYINQKEGDHFDSSRLVRFYLDVQQNQQHDVLVALVHQLQKTNRKINVKISDHVPSKQRFDEIIIYAEEPDRLAIEGKLAELSREKPNAFNSGNFYIYSKGKGQNGIYTGDEPCITDETPVQLAWPNQELVRSRLKGVSYTQHRMVFVGALLMQRAGEVAKAENVNLNELGKKRKLKQWLKTHWNQIIEDPEFEKAYVEMCKKFNINPSDFSHNLEFPVQPTHEESVEHQNKQTKESHKRKENAKQESTPPGGLRVPSVEEIRNPQDIEQCKKKWDQVVNKFKEKPREHETELFWLQEDFSDENKKALSPQEQGKYQEFIQYLKGQEQIIREFSNGISAIDIQDLRGKSGKILEDTISTKAEQFLNKILQQYNTKHQKALLYYTFNIPQSDVSILYRKIVNLIKVKLVASNRSGKEIYTEKQEDGSIKTIPLTEYVRQHGEFIIEESHRVVLKLYELFGNEMTIEDFQTVLIDIIKTKGEKEIPLPSPQKTLPQRTSEKYICGPLTHQRKYYSG